MAIGTAGLTAIAVIAPNGTGCVLLPAMSWSRARQAGSAALRSLCCPDWDIGS
jgi:hypothetical protein